MKTTWRRAGRRLSPLVGATAIAAVTVGSSVSAQAAAPGPHILVRYGTEFDFRGSLVTVCAGGPSASVATARVAKRQTVTVEQEDSCGPVTAKVSFTVQDATTWPYPTSPYPKRLKLSISVTSYWQGQVCASATAPPQHLDTRDIASYPTEVPGEGNGWPKYFPITELAVPACEQWGLTITGALVGGVYANSVAAG